MLPEVSVNGLTYASPSFGAHHALRCPHCKGVHEEPDVDHRYVMSSKGMIVDLWRPHSSHLCALCNKPFESRAPTVGKLPADAVVDAMGNAVAGMPPAHFFMKTANEGKAKNDAEDKAKRSRSVSTSDDDSSTEK
jgi:hypothetical protein